MKTHKRRVGVPITCSICGMKYAPNCEPNHFKYHCAWTKKIANCLEELRNELGSIPVGFTDWEVIPHFSIYFPAPEWPDEILLVLICDTRTLKDSFKESVLGIAAKELKRRMFSAGFPEKVVRTLNMDVTSLEDIREHGGKVGYFGELWGISSNAEPVKTMTQQRAENQRLILMGKRWTPMEILDSRVARWLKYLLYCALCYFLLFKLSQGQPWAILALTLIIVLRDWNIRDENKRLISSIDQNRKVYYTHLTLTFNLQAILQDFERENISTAPEYPQIKPLTPLEVAALNNHPILSKPIKFQIMEDIWTNTTLVYDEAKKRVRPNLEFDCEISTEGTSRSISLFLADNGVVSSLEGGIEIRNLGSVGRKIFFFPYSLVDTYLRKIIDGERFAAIRKLPTYLESVLEFHGFRINDQLPAGEIIEDDSLDTKWAYDRNRHHKIPPKDHLFSSKYCDVLIWKTKFQPGKTSVFDEYLEPFSISPYETTYHYGEVMGKILSAKDTWDHST